MDPIFGKMKINKENIKKILESNNKIIINIDEETSIENFNEVIKIFKSKIKKSLYKC